MLVPATELQCAVQSLDDISEAACPGSVETCKEEKMGNFGEAGTSIPTYANVLYYITGYIQQFTRM